MTLKGSVSIIAANYTAVRNNLKSYCDMASQGETVLVTRKENKNVVVLSLDQYNEMEKAYRNANYLLKLDRSFAQLDAGKGQAHDLIEGD